jgi:hypothetical protein
MSRRLQQLMAGSQVSIPYPELRAVNRLVQRHREAFGDRLREARVFGPLATDGDPLDARRLDIDLLEIVDDFRGHRFGRFTSTPDLPLRGELRLYFLSPEDVADPGAVEPPEDRSFVQQVLGRVEEGSVVVYSRPSRDSRQSDWARTGAAILEPPSGAIQSSDPLDLEGILGRR